MESELKIRTCTLSAKLPIYQSKPPKQALAFLINLSLAYTNLQYDIIKLQTFVQVNSEGFRKILKKWDKRSTSTTKDAYLSVQIKTKHCFNNQSLIELTDAVALNSAEIETLVSKLRIQTNPETFKICDNGADFQSKCLELIISNPDNLKNIIVEGNSIKCKEDIDILSRVVLQMAAIASLDIISFLIDLSLDLNMADDITGRTCVHEVAISGRLDILHILIKHGASIKSLDVYGIKPLHYAAMHGNSNCISLLCDLGSVDNLDHDGFTPLVHAVRGGHTIVIETLLEEGAKLESTSQITPNCLSLACALGFYDVATLLLKKGAQNLPDSEGLLPLHLACQNGHDLIAKLLISSGSSLESCDNAYGWRPVFFAASEGHIDCVKSLIAAGCVINVTDESKWLPWTFALYHGHVEVAKLLQIDNDMSLQNMCSPSMSFENFRLEENALNIDDIPSLSLPPPIIPFRIYGHNYLDKKFLLQIQFGSFESVTHDCPVRIFGSHQLSSLKLEIKSNPENLIPHNLILPQKDVESLPFICHDLKNISLQFDIYPTYGTKAIGHAAILSSMISLLIEQSRTGTGDPEKLIIPLFDLHSKVVGELELYLSIVSPFIHSSLQIGGKIETYWRSTKVITNETPTTSYNNICQSYITASSLAEEYIETIVQVTKDGIPVIYPYWYLPFDDFPIDISSLTFSEAKAIFSKHSDPEKRVCDASLLSVDFKNVKKEYLASIVYNSFLKLEELLQILPLSIGICIALKYPTKSERKHLQFRNTLDLNFAVEKILNLVYDNSNQRSIIFSSANPSVCLVLIWKQPNYGVFFRTSCGFNTTEGPWSENMNEFKEQDIRCNSIKEAVKFAKANNMLGLISESAPLIQLPILINKIKESGLILATCGMENENLLNVKKQEVMGVDAVICNRVFRYNLS